MLPKNTDKDWEYYGEVSPYFGVITDEKFRTENLSETVLADFFSSGAEQVEQTLQLIAKHFSPDFNPQRCLDFGCGVGRIVLPLAKRFEHVVGVDVSRGMLEEAKRNCERVGVKNVEFVESDDALSKVTGSFDFIHSFIVMQHISVARGEQIVQRLFGLLNKGGVAALHFTYSWSGWLQTATRGQRFKRWLKESVPGMLGLLNLAKGRRFDHPYMLMNTYDLNRLLSLLQQHGCKQVHAQFTDHGGHWGVMLVFQK